MDELLTWRRFTIEEYQRMGEAGIVPEDKRLELILDQPHSQLGIVCVLLRHHGFAKIVPVSTGQDQQAGARADRPDQGVRYVLEVLHPRGVLVVHRLELLHGLTRRNAFLSGGGMFKKSACFMNSLFVIDEAKTNFRTSC